MDMTEIELSEDDVVCQRQPNLISNYQLVCVQSNVKVFVYGLQQHTGYPNNFYDTSFIFCNFFITYIELFTSPS